MPAELWTNIKNKILFFPHYLHKNSLAIREFVIRDGKKHPFAIICPGGGYEMLCMSYEGKAYAEYLNSKGISAFAINYRRGRKAHYPAPMDDLAEAIRYVMERAEEMNLEKDNYSIWGSSAGGHLAACMGTERIGYVKYGLPKPRALVLVYPVITMGELTHPGSRDWLIGKEADQELTDLVSVQKQVTSAYPPSYIWCGSLDSTVPVENSRMLAKALEACRIPYQFELYEGVEHGVGLGKGLACEGWIDNAIDFWMAQ